MRYIIMLLLLCACSQPLQISDPVIAQVPVAVSCQAYSPVEPDWNVTRLESGAKPIQELKAVLADLDLSKGYIEELKAELKACS